MRFWGGGGVCTRSLDIWALVLSLLDEERIMERAAKRLHCGKGDDASNRHKLVCQMIECEGSQWLKAQTVQ